MNTLRKGSAIVAVLFTIACITIISASMVHLISFSSTISLERYRYEQQRALAQGVLEYGVHVAQEHFFALLGAAQQGNQPTEICVVRHEKGNRLLSGHLRMEIIDYAIHLVAMVRENGNDVCGVHCMMQADAEHEHYERGDRRTRLQVSSWQYMPTEFKVVLTH